jgi:uncharacterized membrane protein YcaP (DUF421 family)
MIEVITRKGIAEGLCVINFMMDILQNSYIRIVFSSVAVYFFIILAIRLFGKKELAQLSVYDLVFILLISNAVQNAMVGPDSTLTGGLVAAGSLFVVNFILKQLQLRYPKFGKAIQGEAAMLVFEGKILSSNMKKAEITEDELMLQYQMSIWRCLKLMVI